MATSGVDAVRLDPWRHEVDANTRPRVTLMNGVETAPGTPTPRTSSGA